MGQNFNLSFKNKINWKISCLYTISNNHVFNHKAYNNFGKFQGKGKKKPSRKQKSNVKILAMCDSNFIIPVIATFLNTKILTVLSISWIYFINKHI